MIATMLVGALLQTAKLDADVRKGRSQPDQSASIPCELGNGVSKLNSLKELPEDVASELSRFVKSTPPMSDVGGPFNSTDAVDVNVPNRRFFRAYQMGSYWFIWYETGGSMLYQLKTIAIRRVQPLIGRALTSKAIPGTNFAGNPCFATKAILAGVRNTVP